MTAQPRPLIETRVSRIHGRGVFAARRIPSGTRIIEYTGEPLTEAEVDARYDDAAMDQPHTFLFMVADGRYVDAARNGNDARFINHSCVPNCEIDIVKGRIYVRALRTIERGTELTYDYALEVEEDPEPERRELFACRCGSKRCRGTMLDLEPDGTSKRRAS